ncbi:MAG: diguanylate cyclase [Sulfurimonas sp.]|jgi:diguanylate cyclase|uniref:diguanylate cyclase n=1 Tax=Sulfurimonas sp. TaxID=2022749 RepID=UPI0039E52C08
MLYDFSSFFYGENNILLDDFFDKYTTHLNDERNSVSVLTGHYKNILNTLAEPFEEENILTLFEELAKHEVLLGHPYVIMSNEMHNFKAILISKMAEKEQTNDIIRLIFLFKKINNSIAHIYLHSYIKQLLSINMIRINSISDLIDRHLIKHYEAHLQWLTQLASSIQSEDSTIIPELNESQCTFGKWLISEGKNIIHNNSKYHAICVMHDNLHLFGKKIQAYIGKEEYHILITYLEKCELLSLSIGTELALADNILMNTKITKDALTGAMNRHGLKSVFESQYEISLATNNTFVLAMCDLDFFKNLNDKYGHVAGDEMLRLFVNIVIQYTRNSDVVIRYGGEEFIILLPAMNKAKGYEVLEKIRRKFEESSQIFNNQEVKATVSIGLLEIKPEKYYNQKFLNEYINIADQKLYMAKESGRNRVEVC